MNSPTSHRSFKRWSIVPLVGVDLLAATLAIAAVVTSTSVPSALGWVAAFGAALALPLQLLAFLRLRVGRTSRNLHTATVATSAAVVVALGAGVADSSPWPTVVALIGLASVQIYARWYTRLDRAPQNRLAVGQPVPHFEVTDVDGTTVTSTTFLGSPVVFVFIRGNWCPLCVAQVRELAADYQSLADKGIEVALVSPQPLDETRELAERFGVNFRYLVDEGASAATELGILHEGGVPPGVAQLGYGADTVFPTVLVVDAEGTIVFSDETDDYRVRPEPRLFLQALEPA